MVWNAFQCAEKFLFFSKIGKDEGEGTHPFAGIFLSNQLARLKEHKFAEAYIVNDISIVICGAAGQGIQTVEDFLVGILKMSGYHVFATKEYMSRVRGGMNSTELRIGSDRVAAFVDRIDLLIPMHPDAMRHVQHRISKNTYILTDEPNLDESRVQAKEKAFKLPLSSIAQEIGDKIYGNVVVVGVVAGVVAGCCESDIVNHYLAARFESKGAQVVEKNVLAYQKGFALGAELQAQGKIQFDIQMHPEVIDELLFSGVEAVGWGAIAGGCNFISAYPMSPSTDLLTFLAEQADNFGIVVDQAEDEIAAMNKAIGGWYAGARAIASTAGGGFALMVEGLSLAGMMESPLVIHLAQRPAPATGLPTRTAQEDLNLALYAGHGEFPRMIFAPGTIQQAFYVTQRAFNLADKYQVPVFVLTDQYFVDTYYNFTKLDLSKIKVDKAVVKTPKDYVRYKLTDTGVSPRGIPGYGDGFVRAVSDEHTEDSQITEDLLETRVKMVQKRALKKLATIEKEIDEPELVGPKQYKTLVVCWGSNYHIVKEAVEQANVPGVAMLHFCQLYPLFAKTNQQLSRAKKVLILENNATGQFANLIKLLADYWIPVPNRLLKFNGAPFSVEEVTTFIQEQSIKED